MFKKIIKKIIPWKDVDKKIYKLHLKAHKYHIKGKEKIVDYYNYKMYKKYNCIISGRASIKSQLVIPHPIGIIVGRDCEIGKNCTIYQNVTIGQSHEKFPTIGDNVTIYAGAKVIGDVHIGNNVIIGANAVVTHDIPDNCVAVGIPAKIIKKVND